MAWWLTLPVSAALTSLNVSGNFPAGRISRNNDGRAPWLPGTEFEPWTIFCDALQASHVSNLIMSDCYLGPEAIQILATRFSAALTSLTLENNGGIFGELEYGIVKTPDKHAAEAQPFFDAIQASGLTSLSLSGTGMGPVSCGKLAGAVSAALTELNVSKNSIGDEAMQALQRVAPSSVQLFQ